MSLRVLVVTLLLVSAVMAGGPRGGPSGGKPKGKAAPTASQGVIKEGKADPAVKPLFYGAYCGNGEAPGKAAPIDALDTECRNHDVCYAGAKFFDCGCNTQFVSAVSKFDKTKKCKNADCKTTEDRLVKLMKSAPCICRNAVADIAGVKLQVAELTVLSSLDCSAGGQPQGRSASSSSKGSSNRSRGSRGKLFLELAESKPSSSSKQSGSKQGSSKRGSSGSSGGSSNGSLSAEAKAALDKYLTSSKFDEKAGDLCLARQTFLKPKSRKAPLAFKLSGSASASDKAFLAEYEKRVKAGFAALKACPSGTGSASKPKSSSSKGRRF